MSTMMESIALNEDSPVVEDTEYVIVEEEEDDMDVEYKEEDYDYCEDVFSINSPIASSSFSFCSNSMSFDNMDAVLEETENRTVVSLDVDVDDITLGKYEEELEPAHDVPTESTPEAPVSPGVGELKLQKQKAGTSRLSNKKRRKKMKLMKKATAATAAAAALTAGATSPTRSARLVPSKPKGHHKSKTTARSSKKKVSNVAVACATASLRQFRKDHNIMM